MKRFSWVKGSLTYKGKRRCWRLGFFQRRVFSEGTYITVLTFVSWGGVGK